MPRMTAEQIFRGLLRGPLSTVIGNTNPWAGRTTITTASAIASITTTRVDSDSIILVTAQIPVASLGADVAVTSINPGVSFTIGWSDNTAKAVNVPVMWVLYKTQ